MTRNVSVPQALTVSRRGPLESSPTWPEEFRAAYRQAGVWTGESFVDFVADRTGRFANSEALAGPDLHGEWQRWTYRDLAERATRMAAHLSAGGVVAGDRVVLALPNVVEHLATVLGVLRMGAVPVFALPTHGPAELTDFCALTDAAALVLGSGAGQSGQGDPNELHTAVSAAVMARGVEAPARVLLSDVDWGSSDESTGEVPPSHRHAEEVALLQLSGGTTGSPKLIPRTASDYLYSVRASAEICGLDTESRMLVVLPMGHNFTLSSPGVLGILHVGGTVVLANDPSPRTGFALTARERITTVALVPPLAQAWVAAARRRRPDLSTLRSIQVGGAKLAPSVAEQIEPVLGARLQQVFGMAEGLVNYTRADDADDLVCTTQGRPISELDEIRVVDAAGSEVEDGAEGELLTRGPYTIRGYYRAEEVNASAFTVDGFYRTGDLVRRLTSGHLQVTGRVKDQINRSGEKIACVEVEEPLLRHPSVHDAVALGLPDHYLGEMVVAVVVPHEVNDLAALRTTLPDELTAHLRETGLARWKMPDRVLLVEAFPSTHVGKNSRRDLRTHLLAELSAAASGRPAAPFTTDPHHQPSRENS